jgi:hypothetical protein
LHLVKTRLADFEFSWFKCFSLLRVEVFDVIVEI